jgi:uncharacterized protein YecT (DUF1311 family)
MNESASGDLKAAEAEMRKVLGSLRARAAGKAEAIAILDKAQKAWETYRDAQLKAEWPFPKQECGTVYPMCFAIERTKLTRARISELRSMLEAPEGESCASQWPE